MQMFLDSANLDDVAQAAAMGYVDGVTTNPSIISREGKPLLQCIEGILRIDPRLTVLVEVVSKDRAGMEAEARGFAALGKNIVVKLPCTPSGLAAVRSLSREGIRTTVTLVFSVNQAIAAACAGADFVAPFVGRMEDMDADGIGLVRDIKAVLASNASKTRIIAASIRSPFAISRLFLAGADIVTAPGKLIAQMLLHPLTDQGLAKFDQDWAKVPAR